MHAKTVTLTPRSPPLPGRERGERIKNSPLSPCGRGVGGEGDYKNGMLPTHRNSLFTYMRMLSFHRHGAGGCSEATLSQV